MKVVSLTEAVRAIPDGAVIGLGGNTFHRVPCAVVHELVRQRKRNLTLVKTAGAYDIDLLCGAGCATRVVAAYVGFENYGLAPRFRRAVERQEVVLEEHT